MKVEEVKTSFVADTQKYIRDIQKAQKVLNTFLRTDNMTQREKAENRLQVAIQKRARAEAIALTQELKGKQQATSANSKLVSSQNNVNNSISKSSSSSKAFGAELAHVARNVMTLYYSVKSLGKVLTTGIDFNRTKENARLAFTVMFRSADVASKKIQELQEYAVKSPLSFKETISASKQLSAYGFAAEELVPAMEMLGTVAKATGHSLDDISYVYGTLRTQGRAYSRDLMQFSMRGIPIYEELAEVMRVDQKEIKKLTEEGKVGFKEVEKAFKNMTKEGGKFGGLLKEYMKGSEGIASQLEDTFQQSMGKMTEPLFESLKVQMRELIGVMDSGGMDATFRSIGQSLGQLASVVGDLLVVIVKIMPVLIAFGKVMLTLLIVQKLVAAFKMLPNLLVLMSNKVLGLTMAMNQMNVAGWAANMKGAFAYGVQGFKALGVAAKSFALANPWFIALVAGALVVSIAIKIVKSSIDKARKQIEDDIINGFKDKPVLLEFDLKVENIKNIISKIGAAVLPMLTLGGAGLAMSSLGLMAEKKMSKSLTYEEIEKVADAYGITVREAAVLLAKQNEISKAVWGEIAFRAAMTRETKRQNKALAENVRLQEQSYFAEKTGKEATRYASTTLETVIEHGRDSTKNVDVFTTLGARAGQDYVAMFQKALESEKEKINLAYALDPKAADYEKQLAPHIEEFIKEWREKVQGDLEEGAIMVPERYIAAGYGYDEYLRDLLLALEKEFGGGGAGDKKVEIKLDPWFDREKMASATKMIFDDLELQRDKDFATAQEKLDKQEISFEQYSRAINAIHSKYLDDRTEAEKEAVEKTMNLWREGSEDVWRNLSIDAHKELFAFLEDARPIKNFWSSFIDGAKKAKSTVVSAFGHIKDLWDSFENPFSINSSSSPVGVKIDIDKDALKNNMGNMWDKMVIFGNYIRDGFTVFKSNISLFKDGVKKFVEGTIIIGKNVGLEMIKGSQIGNVLSGTLGQRDAAIQKAKDDWIAAGNDPAKFNAGYAKQSFDMRGALAGGGITQLITSFAEMALEVEEVTKVISPFATIAGGAGKFLKPLLSVGFSGVASILKELGEVVGKTLLPLLHPILFALQFFSGILKITVIPVLQFFASIISWLYDKILVPFGNSVIRIINGIIGLINKIPGIEIEKLRYFETTTEMLTDSSESMIATMEYMTQKLNSMIDKELQSLQDLYEVGAISGAEMKAGADELNLRRLSLEENLIDVNVAQMNSLTDIYNWLVENGAYADLEALLAAEKLGVELPEGFYNPEDTSTYITQTNTPFWDEGTTQAGKQWEMANELSDSWGDKAGVIGTAAGALVGGVADVGVAIGTGVAELAGKIGSGIASFFGFADGTSNIPYDMVANVHKGEGVVPATFMDSIRSGELTLSGNSGTSSGSITNYYITVEGSVTSENDLADSLAEKIEQRRTRGYGRK